MSAYDEPKIEAFRWVDTDETVDWRHHEKERKERARRRAAFANSNARKP
jgi:hypothetical protein